MASEERGKRKKPEKPTNKALEDLRKIRSGESTSVTAYKPVNASIYDELNEDEYEDRKKRRQKFVVEDDDGVGYDDHGDEDLNNDEDEEEDFEDFEEAEVDGVRQRSKRAKVTNKAGAGGAPKPTAEKKKPEPLPSQRLAALMKGSSAASSSTQKTTARKDPPLKPKTAAEDDIESMLEDLVANPKEKQKSAPSSLATAKLFKPKPKDTASTPSKGAKATTTTTSPLASFDTSPAKEKGKGKKSQPNAASPSTTSATSQADAIDALTADLPDSFYEDDVVLNTTSHQPAQPQAQQAQTDSTSAGKKKVVIQQHDSDSSNDWWALGQDAAAVVDDASTSSSASSEIPKASLGDLKFYWIDALEDFHNPGTLFLFGKIYQEETKRFVSCTVTVTNMVRCMFIAPRPFILDEFGNETNVVPTRDDINKELEPTRQKLNIKKWMTKVAKRIYCFDGHPDVPRGLAEFIKAKYPATSPALPSDLSGKTFSHIFGTHSSLLELFLLKRKVMGPCWLTVKNTQAVSVQVTWSKCQVSVESMGDISVMRDPPPAPSVSVLSVKVMTVLDEATRANEIVMVSGIFHPDVNTEGPTNDPHKKFSHFTALRALKSTPLPFDFAQAIKKHPAVQPCTNERALLACVIGKIYSLDPDVIVGHNFLGFDLDVLLHRMEAAKIPHWSKLGRLKTNKMPKLQSGRGGASDSTWAEKGVMAGRLVCDTWISSKDILREKNYRLTDLAESQLGIQRKEIEPEEVAAYYESSESLLYLTKYTENDCFLAMSLMFKLNLLPLTKQLTNISGNLWGHSLMGRRAERIEYLLLHEFYSKKYIVPDKATTKEKMEKKTKESIDGKNLKSKKPKYAGGLVLAPEQGLYDKYVMLLDFNSLYPSIIQEHNICFTTTERHQNENGTWDEASPPPPGTDQGILPKVIGYLVKCRRDVKNVMKGQTDPTKVKQLEIRQQALKLIANSMYGCLGFVFSRFYAHPLAELVTRKGRETLQRAVDLAKSLNYHVIYGDTDSIMINTGLSELNEVMKVGTALKKEINKLFKLLEIDIDGIFKSILLQKKKKYAALVVTVAPDGTEIVKRQAKGLDLVRRDWCDLSKVMGNTILDLILSGKPRDEIIDGIHQYLRTVKEDIEHNKIPITQYTITKGLTKEPEDYQDAKSQPHVQVALKMRNMGKRVRQGDFIPYVICEGQGSFAERAFSPDQIARSDGILKVDTQWYLTQQILPPVSRLCENIQGTDIPQLAACLGLDPSKYNRTILPSTNEADNNYFAPASEMDAEEKFKNAEKFQVLCRFCGQTETFQGAFRDYAKRQSGLSCKCGEVYTSGLLQNQLELAFRALVQKQYTGWLECDEHSCKNRTRQSHFYKTHCRCIVPGCKGVLRPEVTAEHVYTQLQYYQHLFDLDKYKPPGKQINEPVRNILSAQDQSVFAALHKRATHYLSKSALHHVNLASWFSYYDLIKQN